MPGNSGCPNADNGDRKVILCIDDEAKLLMVRQMVLSAAGYSVLIAPNGRTGLKLFRSRRIDLVITDHLLPDLSGAQVAIEMRRTNPDVPIILLTGLPDAPKGAEYADVVLTKSLAVPDFLRSVAELTNSCNESFENTDRPGFTTEKRNARAEGSTDASLI